MSPFASETLGRALHALSEVGNLEDYIGHDCYVVAASAIVYNAIGRLADDHTMAARFRRHVEFPATSRLRRAASAHSWRTKMKWLRRANHSGPIVPA
jgi:hypothetical protein